jgi:putative DNA primase/helicase
MNQKPKGIGIKFENIPDELKALKKWMLWDWRWNEKKNKWDKIPRSVNGRVSSTDPKTWCSYKAARAVYDLGSCDGIGFTISADDPYCGIDLDDCRDPVSGKVTPEAEAIIRGTDSYTEISPSETGFKVTANATLPKGGHHNANLGIFDQGRFWYMTGHSVSDVSQDIERRQSLIEDLVRKHWPGDFKESKPKDNHNSIQSTTILDDRELINKASHAKNGDKFSQLYSGTWENDYPSQSEADQAFCNMLAFWCGRDSDQMDRIFRQSGLYRDKWDRDDYSSGTINKAIDQCGETYSLRKNSTKKEGGDLTKFPFTDMGNAERLASRHGIDLRYCHPFARWYVWSQKHWAEDDTGEIKRRCKSVIRDMYAAASKLKDDDRRKALIDYARKCESNQKVQNMLALAQSEINIPILPDEMDTDPWLFNCRNGTIDLRSGDLKPHNRANLITKMAPYNFDPGAQCPAWLDHLNKIFSGDQEIIHFLQQAFGYSMTGDTSERLVFISWGGGANGKSVTHDTIARAIGDYAMRTPTETLLVKRNEGIPNDVARLMGARFVYASEAEQGKRLAESLIKDMSGGEKIAARFMRAEWFEFYPEFKIWLSTNHKPIIRGTDSAIWDRIRLIPFDVTIPPDQRIKKEVIEKMLESEMPGILAWLVRGCLDWQKNGLKTPKAVIAATGKYRDEMDVIGEFIAECCSTGETLSATAKDLYAAYESFCEENGDRAVSKKLFGMKLEEKGFDSFRGTRGVRTWIGISLITSDV